MSTTPGGAGLSQAQIRLLFITPYLRSDPLERAQQELQRWACKLGLTVFGFVALALLRRCFQNSLLLLCFVFFCHYYFVDPYSLFFFMFCSGKKGKKKKGDPSWDLSQHS